MTREFKYINPGAVTPDEASTLLREHLYKTAKKAEEIRRDVIYMEELFFVIQMAYDL